MIGEPKPPSGASPEAAWHRQLLDWVKGWRVLSIEGYREEQTTSGRKFNQTFKIVQGGGGGMNLAQPNVTYDPTLSYSGTNKKRDVVVVRTMDPMVATCTIDPDTQLRVFSSPGMWVCLKNTAPVQDPNFPDDPTKLQYYIPQVPMPSGDDNADDPRNHWYLIASPSLCSF